MRVELSLDKYIDAMHENKSMKNLIAQHEATIERLITHSEMLDDKFLERKITSLKRQLVPLEMRDGEARLTLSKNIYLTKALEAQGKELIGLSNCKDSIGLKYAKLKRKNQKLSINIRALQLKKDADFH